MHDITMSGSEQYINLFAFLWVEMEEAARDSDIGEIARLLVCDKEG